MSMTLDLADATRTVLADADFAQSVEYLARGGGRRSTHFFFFGGGAGMLLWIPLLALGFLGAFLKRNPDKARVYKDRLKNGFAGLSSGVPPTGTYPSARPAGPTVIDSPSFVPGTGGRPPRLSLPMRAGQVADRAPQPGSPAASTTPNTVAPLNFSRPDSSPVTADIAPAPLVATPGAAAARQDLQVPAAVWRFNPPPSWQLPAGFTPGQGWTPDPSWAPAPAGWNFWIAG